MIGEASIKVVDEGAIRTDVHCWQTDVPMRRLSFTSWPVLNIAGEEKMRIFFLRSFSENVCSSVQNKESTAIDWLCKKSLLLANSYLCAI